MEEQETSEETGAPEVPAPALESCATEFKYASLPEHLLVQIFEYTEHTNARFPTSSTSDSYNVFFFDEWPKTQTNISLVCKSWHHASSHSSLWKKTVEKLMLRLNSTLSTPIANNFKALAYSTRLPCSEKEIPQNAEGAKMYKQHFFTLQKKMRAKLQTVQKRENTKKRFHNQQMALNASTFTYPFYTSMVALVYLLGIILFIAVSIHDFIGLPRWAWPITFSPFYLFVLVYIVIFTVLLYTIIAEECAKEPTIRRVCREGWWFLPMVSIPLGFIVYMFAIIILNISLPPFPTLSFKITDPKQLETWDRRWGVIPWHVALWPIIVLFYLAAIITQIIILSDASKRQLLRAPASCPPVLSAIFNCCCRCVDLSQYCKGDKVIAHWICFVLACFATTFLLIGFHLEFPKHFHIAITFAPAYVAELFSLVAFAYLGAKQFGKKTTLTSDKIIDACLLAVGVAFDVSLIFMHVAFSLYKYIRGLAWLSLIVPWTLVAAFFFILIYDRFLKRFCCCCITKVHPRRR